MTGAFDNRSKSNLESISLTITKAIKLDMSIKNMEAPTHAQFVLLKSVVAIKNLVKHEK